MASTTAWIAGRGPGLTWTTAGFTAGQFASVGNGSVVVAGTALVNGTNLDLYADVSFVIVAGGTTTAGVSYFTLYLLPLNQDGTTYGDNIASGTVAPAASYQVSAAGVLGGVASGSTVAGMFRGIVLPPGSYKFAIVNNMGVTTSATTTGTVVNYRTYNENLNA